MRRQLGRTALGALALGSLVACNAGAPPEAAPRTMRLGLLDGPDFVVTALSIPPSATPGTGFQVTLTVCNQGNVADWTDVTLVLSQDSDISLATDVLAGNAYIGYLSPGACVTSTGVVGGPPTPGRWYVGAVVDPYGNTTERDESNNTRLGGALGIGYGPDFIITRVEGIPAAVPNMSFTASVTVCNQGTTPDTADVTLYLSTDAVIQPPTPTQPGDMAVGGGYVGYLVPGQCTTAPLMVTANLPPPGTEGAYHLGAAVDPLNQRSELAEDNNTNAGYRLGVGYRADFIVTRVKAPASVTPGQPLEAAVTVCNQGTMPGDTDVGLYLSADADIHPPSGPAPTEDAVVGVLYPVTLASGQCSTLPFYGNVSPPPPGTEGAYHLGAVADPGNTRQELIEDNNTDAATVLGVGYRPDFTITSVQGPASALPGESFEARVTVCNQGTTYESTEVTLYVSADDAIQPVTGPQPSEDLPVGGQTLGALAPGQCVSARVPGNMSLPSPGLDGLYHLGAVVDGFTQRQELREDNNIHPGYALGVGHGADLVVTEVKGPGSVRFGQLLTAQVTVCNQGNAPASADAQLFLSTDATFQLPGPGGSEDLFLGAAPVGTLQPGQCATASVSGNAYPPSTPTKAFWLGAAVMPLSGPELNPENNTRAGYRLGVGDGPDFVVTSVQGPASVLPGQSLTALATVCNQGTQPDSAEVRLFLSEDDVIQPLPGPQPTDWSIGAAYVDLLSAGRCVTVPVSGNVNAPTPPPGAAYHLGAAVDPFNQRPELVEDNNTNAGYVLGLGSGPDFIVTSVKGPTNAVPPGQPVSAQVTVCNQGTQPGDTDVVLLLSAEPLPASGGAGMPEASLVASAPVAPLVPGQCGTVSLSGNANLPWPYDEGAYHLGALVDPGNSRMELIEDNNTNAGQVLGVGSKPDFVVTSVQGPTGVLPGQSFTARVTVCNQGTQPGDTDVLLLLSQDATPRAPDGTTPPEDLPVGGTFVSPLVPGQCVTASVTGTANLPSSGAEGAWYLGAVVDPAKSRAEIIESNNANAGYRLGVGSKPDFVVTDVKGPASVLPDQPLTAQVTVCNQGMQPGDTEVGLYLSADAIIQPGTAADALVGRAAVGPLSPGLCATVSVSGNAALPPPGTEGPYRLGAVVDPNNTRAELIEDNNTHASAMVGVGSKPDFTVTGVKGPASVLPGQSFTAQVTVCNQGMQPGNTDVAVYLSADGTVPTLAPLGATLTASLYPGQCASVPVSGTAYPPPPGAEGAYHLVARVDPVNTRVELIEDNNTHAGYVLGVGKGPDFVVTSVKGPSSVLPGQPLAAQVTVCNQGTQPADTDVALLLSNDDVFVAGPGPTQSQDVLVGFASVPPLGVDQCATVTVSGSATLPFPGTDGPYHLGAVVDPNQQRPELVEGNNASAGYRLGVGSRADLVITSVKGPANVPYGELLRATVSVCNQGTQPESVEVELYLSADATIRPSTGTGPSEDARVGGTSTGMLDAGQCVAVPVSGNAYPPPPTHGSAFYLGAVVDPKNVRVELIEDNNTHSGYRLGVGTGPDFIVTDVTGPSSVQAGQPFTAQVTVCNQGTQLGNTDVGLFLSADDVVLGAPGPDMPVGQTSVGLLNAGQCATVPVPGRAYPFSPGMEGPYHLGAVADLNNARAELIDDNNAFAGYRLGVGSKPDFVVTDVKGPASVTPGASFTASVTVCNQGQAGQTADVQVYLSADGIIRVSTPSLPGEDFLLGTLTGVSVSAGACTTRSLAVALPSVPQGGYTLGAVVDPANLRAELIEDNNTLAGSRLGVGTQPDFAIGSVTSSATVVRPGASLPTSTSICNRGQAGGVVDVELYLFASPATAGTRASPSSEAVYLGRHTGVSLGAGGCSTRALNVVAPTWIPEGTYFVGAVADPLNARVELIEDNNVLTGSRVGVGVRPELVVSAVSAPTSVQLGAPLTTSITVCNRGTAATTTDVEVLLSVDTLIRPTAPGRTPEDTLLGTLTGVSLGINQCVTQSLAASASAPATGSYYVGAVVDPRGTASEFFEDNNALAGTRVSVTP